MSQSVEQLMNNARLAIREHPGRRASMYQSWRELLFLHWRFDAAVVQRLLPPGLTVETYDGSAWVAVVPFLMRNIRPASCPAVPYISNFLELNVRTYVVDEHGTAGVWFFSLSANRWIAVVIARRTFHLPYHWASMQALTDVHGATLYRCRRFDDPLWRTSRYKYTPHGEAVPAVPGTLEFFLIERYVLFSQSINGEVATGQVHHSPYQIQSVTLEQYDSHMLEQDGFSPPGRPPDHVTYSPGVDVEVFALQRSKARRLA